MERAYRYRVVDVFTDRPLEGNPLAVFADASGLDAETMQAIARELNLSETVFVLPSNLDDCVARLRIFTPRREMPFAGHPTVGAAFVLIDGGMVAEDATAFGLEEGIGRVPVVVEPGDRPLIWLTTPRIEDGVCIDRATAGAVVSVSVEHLLDLPAQVLNAGNPTLFVPVRDRTTVDAAALDTSAWAHFKSAHRDPLCVFVFAPTREGAYSRMFAPDYGIVEDPATGSSTGPLAAFMMRHRLAPSRAGTRLVSEQGTQMGRRSLIHVAVHGENGCDGIAVGGYVTPIIDGVMTL